MTGNNHELMPQLVKIIVYRWRRGKQNHIEHHTHDSQKNQSFFGGGEIQRLRQTRMFSRLLIYWIHAFSFCLEDPGSQPRNLET